LTRVARFGTVLAAAALAACVDTQAPDQSRSAPTTPDKPDLPVLETMRVTAAATNASQSFEITLRFINTPTTAQRAFFQTAAARWQGIILGDVPNSTGTIPARACGGSFPTPSFRGEIDDVMIDVLLQPIDGPGRILGAAGPCLVRREDFLTVYGLMFFDVADLGVLEQFEILDEVIVHEMGHVLGIGTLWDFGRDLLQGTAADPRFVGPAAIAGYVEVGGRGISVPVEEDFGPGTRFSHWDEETFDEELMTGFISLKGDSPLSVITTGSMSDLGYVATNATADRYRVSGRQERVAGDVTAERLDIGRREKLIQPTGFIE
jgi:hypothetical protein